MPTDVGETTRDLLDDSRRLPGEPPAPEARGHDREEYNRRYGRHFGQAGAAVVALTLICVAVIPEHVAEVVPRIVAAAIVTSLLLLGFGGLLIWVMERLTRYNRSLTRRVLAQQDAQAEQLKTLTEAVANLTPALQEQIKKAGADGWYCGYASRVKDEGKPNGTTGEVLHLPRNGYPRSL